MEIHGALRSARSQMIHLITLHGYSRYELNRMKMYRRVWLFCDLYGLERPFKKQCNKLLPAYTKKVKQSKQKKEI